MAHTLPARRLTGEGLDIKPSDNVDMLRALGRDELVIKATRVDVLYGVSNLMDTALLAARGVRGNVLLLYGQHDEIIPSRPTCQLLEYLSGGASTQLTAIVYPRGYHMLTRDLQAEVVLKDIASWIDAHQASRLSGRDLRLYCAQPGGGS